MLYLFFYKTLYFLWVMYICTLKKKQTEKQWFAGPLSGTVVGRVSDLRKCKSPKGREEERKDRPRACSMLLSMGLPKCTQWDSIPSALKHMSQQVRERVLYLVLMYGFQAIRNPQNCMQNVKCTCTFLGKGI